MLLGQKILTSREKLQIKVTDIWENIKTNLKRMGKKSYTDLMNSSYETFCKMPKSLYVDKCKSLSCGFKPWLVFLKT